MKPSMNQSTEAVVVNGTLMIRDIPKRAGGSFKVGKLSTHIGQFEVKNPELDQYDAGTYTGQFCIDKIYPSHYMAGGKIVIEMRAVLSCFVLAGFDDETGEVEPLEVDPAEEEEAAHAAQPEPAPASQPTQQEAVPASDDDGEPTEEMARRMGFEVKTHRLVPTRGEGYVGVEVKDGNPVAAPAAEEAQPEPDAAPADNIKVMSVEEEQAFRLEQMDKDTFGAELWAQVHAANVGDEVKLDPTVGRNKLRPQCDRLKALGFKFIAARQVWEKL
ncbi:MAG: DUF3275 family protein [Thiothrix sp.]|uniref:DUF3275 family protein n=1 Tax=Thiothrix sp. TaxID=1032 RepID=UPI002608AD9F|nr:DUF3275 family protein [Thiothrix sp.]MDD5394835.1 DUF3275 family protein [Thiothrix sp.]